jgi:hypothetical protein
MLGDFEEQAGKSEHEARLRKSLGRQSELNAALDLDKGDRQIAPPDGGEGGMRERMTGQPVRPRAPKGARNGSGVSGHHRTRRWNPRCGRPADRRPDRRCESDDRGL